MDGFEWDEAKRAANRAKLGVDFAIAEIIDWRVNVTIRQRRDDEDPS